MKKTLFLSEATPSKVEGQYQFTAPYIFFSGGKWREDTCYFSDKEQTAKKWRSEGYLIN